MDYLMAFTTNRNNIQKFVIIGMMIMFCLIWATNAFELCRWQEFANCNCTGYNIASFYNLGVFLAVTFCSSSIFLGLSVTSLGFLALDGFGVATYCFFAFGCFLISYTALCAAGFTMAPVVLSFATTFRKFCYLLNLLTLGTLFRCNGVEYISLLIRKFHLPHYVPVRYFVKGKI